MSGKTHTIFYILFLFILSALMMLRQLMSGGYFSVIIDDSYTHTSWAWQFTEALKEGLIYPRWMPLNFWGYGSPTFILYPPLAYYLVAFFSIFTDSVITAMNITKFMSLFLSATGMFFLVREFYSSKTACLTSAFYILQPYNIHSVYFSGTFASTISFMWFSPICIFIFRYIKTSDYRYLIYAGACYGGLISTHLINAYMFTFVWVTFVVYLAINKKRLMHLATIPLIAIIVILVSSAYLLPLIYEKQFLNFKTFAEDFNFADYFILPNLIAKFPQHLFWPIYYTEYVFYVLFFSVLMILSFLQIQKLNRFKIAGDIEDKYTVSKFFLGMAIVSIFLLFGPSTFLWENIPFFNYIQFPVRWLNITSFAVVFLSAALFDAPERYKREKKSYSLIIAILFTICFIFDYDRIYSAPLFSKQELMPVREVNWTPEHLPSSVNFDVIYKNRASKKAEVIRGEGNIEIIRWKSAERTIKISAKEPLTLRIKTFYFPGWKAYIDKAQTDIQREDGSGAVLINISKGEHTLELRFEDTPIRYYSKVTWVISILLLFLFVVWKFRHR